MKFTSLLLAIALAIGHVAATPINDAPPQKISFTYWPQPAFKGAPVNVSVSAVVACTSQSPLLSIQSMTVQAGAVCTLFISRGCSGDSLMFAGSNPSIPPPFAGNVSSYDCNFLN